MAGGAGVARATPLEFLFGEPPLDQRPAYRLRRRPAPPLTRPQPPEAEIPLPVPRPHFPGDPPAGIAEADKGAPPAAPAPSAAQPSKPTDAPAAGSEALPPLPPPKPADLDKPAAPAAVAPSTNPEPPRPEAEPEAPESAATKPETPKAAAPPAPKTAEPAAPSPAPSGPAKGAASSAPPPAQPPTPPPKPPEVGTAKPDTTRPAASAVAPSGATTAFTPRSPEDDPQCPSRLAASRVDVAPTAIGPQPDARCMVVQPVHLNAVTLADGAQVEFPEHPTIACTTADSFSSFVRDLLVPLAKGTFGAPVTAVWTGPGLECRSRDHVFGAKLSAHGLGLAIDIARLKLADGRLVEVGTPKTDAETAFETAARAGACGYFHTVLGPGSDSYHRTHWHFDLEVRGAHGDSKYCK